MPPAPDLCVFGKMQNGGSANVGGDGKSRVVSNSYKDVKKTASGRRKLEVPNVPTSENQQASSVVTGDDAKPA